MSQNGTSPGEPRELEPRQVRVLELLLAGASVTEAARQAGVGRSTVHRWLREDHAFEAAYNAARRDLRREMETQLLLAAAAAAATVRRAIEAGDVPASLSVLKGIGALGGTGPEIGPDTAEEVQHAGEEAEASRVFRWLAARA